ncbi:MAG TPA: amidohydrolase family protein [Planctomycetes bacterium]|nr:amidohydrolase family protein [Planctomycetota bacterium]
MIVDCHTHISSPSSEIDVAEHLEACEKVDACIVLARGPGDSAEVNKEVSKYVKGRRKLVGFAIINPTRDKVGTRPIKANTSELGLAGVVVYCPDRKFHPAHSRAMRLYEACEELALPVFFHNGAAFGPDSILQYAQPYLLDEVAQKFGSLKIIIGSMGVPFVSQTISMLAKHENVYADLTISPKKVWQIYNIVLSAHEAGVMDKLLFGSGYPFARADNCIETLLGFNKLLADTSLPTVPREKIRAIIERDTLALLGVRKG